MTTNYFAYKLIPPRPTFAADMSDEETAIMSEHVAYWRALLEKGRAVVFGAVLDPVGSWGLAIVEAESEEDVRAIAMDDPAVKTQMSKFEVYPMPGAIVRPAQI